jgi:enamine deaminase RidA (YjgF/YER057c/UK114 family)
MGSDTVLKLDYLSLAELAARPAAWWQHVMGVAGFDAAPAPAAGADIPTVAVATRVLGENIRRYEVWRSDQHARTGTRGGIHYKLAGGVVFGSVMLAESEPVASAADPSALQRATELAYREIFALLDAVGVPHLVRVWNYLPDINGETHGCERYWQFNSARQDAFLASGRAVTGAVPAACGVGSARGTPLVIYFLATDTAPTVIENGRQVSAYNYPPEYSPRSPTFSRACLANFSNGQMLFISGTASILGHATAHGGDAAAQTRETLRNIDALLGAANRAGAACAAFTMQSLWYKAYVRHAADQATIARELGAVLGERAQVLYLRADLCRQDLLVEIEATGSYSVTRKT